MFNIFYNDNIFLMYKNIFLSANKYTAIISLITCHSDSTEKEATGLTDWRQITRDAGAEVLLETAHGDGEVPQAGGDAPHHGESDERELTAPPQGDEGSAQRRHNVVAAVLAAVEAEIAGLPHTVYAVGARGFGQDVLKAHLVVDSTNKLYFYQLKNHLLT